MFIQEKSNKLKYLLLAIFLIENIAAYSQDDATNTGTMVINSETIVAAEGSFTITPAGSTENGGDFYLKGHWTNNGSYITSIGKVTFWGSTAQTINGTVSTNFYNAEVNKSANGVSLNVNNEVSHILSLTNGEVDLHSKTLIISNSGITGIGYTNGYLLSEETDNSSILQWNIGSTIGAHIIPFGKSASVIIPLTLNLTSGNAGNVLTSTYPTSSANTPYPVTPISVLNVNGVTGFDNSANMVDRFWEIDKTGPSGTFTITFTYDDFEKPSNGEVNLVAQRYNSSNSGWDPAVPFQTANAVINTVSAPGINTFGPYVLTQSAFPLPVELLSFNAAPGKQKQVNLNWVTGSERNSDFFTIEKSKDGKNFEVYKYVKAAGNSTSSLLYKDIDTNPYDGISYYRLKQTDFNGEYFLSEIKSVNFSKAILASISIFPNPAISSAAIYFNYPDDLNGMLKVEIYDATGKLIISKEFNQVNFINKEYLVIERNNMAAGLYGIKIIQSSQILYTGKLMFK